MIAVVVVALSFGVAPAAHGATASNSEIQVAQEGARPLGVKQSLSFVMKSGTLWGLFSCQYNRRYVWCS